MSIDHEGIFSQEVHQLEMHVAAIGIEPKRASDAIAYAAKELTREFDIPHGQLKVLRRIVARLIAYRLARITGRICIAEKNLKRYDALLDDLIRDGVSKESIEQLSRGITIRLKGERRP
jgi:hypothetical protein